MGEVERCFLWPYRVLYLKDHCGLLAGHMLAQLGAEVIQVFSRPSMMRNVGKLRAASRQCCSRKAQITSN